MTMRTSTALPTLTFILSVALSACSSTPGPRPTANRATPHKAQVRKTYLHPHDIERVRSGEFVKTYHVGRSVGGRGGRTMHEAHRVYRLEKANRWNLARHQPPLAGTGPVDKVVDSAFTPAPRSKAIQAELKRQKEISVRLTHARDELDGALATMKSEFGQARKEVDIVASLKREIRRLQALLPPQAGSASEESSDTRPSADPGAALRQWGASLEEPDAQQAK